MVEPHCSNFRLITTIFWVSGYLGNLWYVGEDFKTLQTHSQRFIIWVILVLLEETRFVGGKITSLGCFQNLGNFGFTGGRNQNSC